jgi:serine/threonine protein kinase
MPEIMTYPSPQGNVRVCEGGHARIVDFGMGKMESITGCSTVGNPNPRYFAPELLASDDETIRPTCKSDVYSFAMLMLQVSPDNIFTLWG